MVKAVIFDLDGTLLDTLEDLYRCCNYGLTSNGYPERTKDEIRQFVGNGFKKLIQRAVPENTSNENYQKVYDSAMTYYAEHYKDYTKPYDGIEELISSLNNMGIKTAIVSNKPDARVKELARLYFNKYTTDSIAIGDRDGYNKKPAPDSVLSVMDTLNVSKQDCIYVGDSDVDITTAKNAGVKGISVTWGFRDKNFLIEHGATTMIDKPQQLLEIIKQ